MWLADANWYWMVSPAAAVTVLGVKVTALALLRSPTTTAQVAAPAAAARTTVGVSVISTGEETGVLF